MTSRYRVVCRSRSSPRRLVPDGPASLTGPPEYNNVIWHELPFVGLGLAGGAQMPVIDVDAHFEPTEDWLGEFPALRRRLPELFPDTDPRFRMNSAEMFAFFCSDDLLRHVPIERRMPIGRLVTPAMQVMFDPQRPAGVGYDGASQFPELSSPDDRLAWMDTEGIA